MTNNVLIKILASLSRKEMTRFREFAHSPYFNKHKDVQSLAEYLSGIYPDFVEKHCNREVIFQHLYPALPFKQQQLAIIFTYTLRLLEQYLSIEQGKSEGLLDDKTLFFRRLRHLDLHTLFEKTWEGKVGKTEGEASEAAPGRSVAGPENLIYDSLYFEKQFKKAAELDAYATRFGQHDRNYLGEKQTWLDAFYLSEKLKDACELLQRSKMLKMEFAGDSLLNAMLDPHNPAGSSYLAFPPVAVYTALYKLLKGHVETDYRQVLAVVESNEQFLPVSEVQNIYNYLQNYCIEQINRGSQVFLTELFAIYRSQLQKELLFVDGHLPEWHYKNIITTALRLDEYQWVRTFLEDYRQHLHPDVAENAYSYNLAAWHYHLKNYEAVLNLLVKIEYTDLRYNLDAKSMLLRTYYDLDEEEALNALADAFKQFLKRNRTLSDFQKKGYFSLLNFSKRAFRLKSLKGITNRQKWLAEFEKLRKEIETAETIFNQTWLESKVTELTF